jgi:CHAT domain
MKLVVRFADNGKEEGRVFVSVDESPAPVPNLRQLEELDVPSLEALDSPAPNGLAKPLMEVGGRLLHSLSRHEGFETALQVALANQDACPIYLRFTTELATEYPWETLYAEQGNCFLALERRWPIARIADFGTTEKEVRHFSKPLRVLAVLSAVDVPAEPEWRGLWEALKSSQMPFELHVIAGQLSVKQEIEALEDPRLRVSVLTSRDALLLTMQRAQPHLVHMFCHGNAGTSPMLMLGTPADHVAGRSSVFLEADTLRGVTPTAWLLTLNCCEGAGDLRGAPSLTHLLVAAGFPAVIGMRKPLANTDAHLFTRSFYGSLVAELEERLVEGSEVEVELSSLLHAPRQALRGQLDPGADAVKAAGERPNWTFPVLYIRPEPLRLHPAPTSDRQAPQDVRGGALDEHRREYLTAYLDMVRSVRLELHAETPPAKLLRLDERIATTQRELEAAT